MLALSIRRTLRRPEDGKQVAIATLYVTARHAAGDTPERQDRCTARPAMKPSDATISSISSCGIASCVVTTITASPSSRVLAVAVVGLVADGGGVDVDAVRAERRADAADHAGQVAVAEQRQVVLELEVEAPAPGLEQVRAVAAAERRADDALALLAADERHADELGEVARARARRLARDDSALGRRSTAR